ncbi:unnamed protein product [Somion occarium]|uniref:Cobalamin-independent methionine synthase MetE C-terminal/archaeal domain-containing protein n=1 Tax=Somion occarium TaxID=3059160 RepID=A0ABP1CIV8_9APHY
MSPFSLHPPSRAEHVGSLLRPKSLLEKREQFSSNQCTAEELRAAEDAAIASVVKLQQEIGLKTITDGEFRRAAFYDGMFDKLEGMTFVPDKPLSTCKSYLPYIQVYRAMGFDVIPSVYCTGKIKRTEGVYTADFEYLRSLVAPEEVKQLKITICSPIWLHIRHGSHETYDLSVYHNDAEYFADLTKAWREEIRALHELGCRHIQIDDPSFCFFCADSMISGMQEAGEDYETLLSQYINVYNDILNDRPEDLIVGIHMCRGNYRGTHYCEGGYERIAARLFKELNVNCFYLEYDNERAGGLEPLRHLPTNKIVVLGLVSTKTEVLETLDDIKTRIEQAVNIIAEGYPKRTRHVALQQICISPQCGFASTAEGNPIKEQDQRRKLDLIVEAARVIWP